MYSVVVKSTVEEAIADFKKCYDEMREHYASINKPLTEADFEFHCDTATS